MRIGIDASQLLPKIQAGFYSYTRNLAQGLSRLQTASRITLFAFGAASPEKIRELAELYQPLCVRHFRSPGRPYRLRLALDPISHQDAMFYIVGRIAPPVAGRINAFLIPDLTPLHDPLWHTEENRQLWLEQYEVIRECADVIITFSEHTKRDVVEHLRIPAEKIHAIPLAASDIFRPLEDRDEVARELQASGLTPGQYILSVGTLEPRKNHLRLVRAYHQLLQSGRAANQLLVLAGPKGWNYEALFAEIERLNLGSHVRHLGHFPRLEVLLNGATALAYPSLFEGFGLPPLEAMACGTPVVASNTSSIPEVVGDAGLLIDPHDEAQLANALGDVIANPDLRQRLREAGLARARQFHWDETARQTLGVLERAVGQRKTRRRFRFAAALTKSA